jgi:sulfur carrier protein ThiS
MANGVFCKVAKLGQEVKEVSLATGATVRDALAAAGMAQGQDELKVNGNPVTLDTPVQNGTIIVMVPPIKGGE